ncbi:MAG: 2-oxoglutarate dehydrogenase E1 component, partial [Saprospiraceae bacterium]|nr:2-oxoglutarate dehydrogenase E1 component [Saprospiraceae bacterium]
MTDLSAIFNAHPQYIESLYQSWRLDPESVEADWNDFFKGFDFAVNSGIGTIQEPASDAALNLSKEFAVLGLIHGYRDRAHTLSTTNPIKPRKDRMPKLDLIDYGLTEADLDSRFAAGYELKMPNATLREIIDRLKFLYCGNIGFECTHVFEKEKREWLRQRIENRDASADYGFSLEKKKRILEKINGAVGFEQFLATKFVGQKRF